MKSAITIALVAGTASATSLRSDRSFDISTVHSTSFIEALASKYNCREAGATLEETLTKVKAKNAGEQSSLSTECAKRRTDYTSPWEAAQSSFDTETPKVVPEETATFNTKVSNANAALAAVRDTMTKAVNEATSKADAAKQDADTKNTVFLTAKGAYEGALKTFETEKNTFLTETKPTGLKNNQVAYDAAKKLADTTFATAMSEATKAKASAVGMCESVTAARKKHVDTDEKLLSKDIAPLIQQLSALKCVDSYDTRRKAAGLSLIETENQAKCAMTREKVSAFLQVTTHMKSLPLSAQFSTFTDRVAQERKHMQDVHNKCIAVATSAFQSSESAAQSLLATTSARISDIKAKADQALEADLQQLIDTNNKIVAEKKDTLVGPRAASEDANKALIAATTALDSAKNTQQSEEAVALTQQKNAIAEATSTKESNIKSRLDNLNTIKKTAEAKFGQDKKFVEEYCASSKKDLEKEASIVAQIEAKLGGLKVTNTATIGAASTDRI